jgi:cbb3-type cytochrome oxidase subunit 3
MTLTDVMSGAGLAGYAVAAMILFMLVFVGVVVWTFWPGRRREMEAASRLPLDDGDGDGAAPRPGGKP